MSKSTHKKQTNLSLLIYDDISLLEATSINKSLGLISIQIVCHSDCIPESIFFFIEIEINLKKKGPVDNKKACKDTHHAKNYKCMGESFQDYS